MKKTILYISAVAMIAAVSCNKVELNNSTDPQNSSESLVFTAYADEETKTTLNDDKTVSWSAEDVISINGVQYITDEGGKVASFRKFDNEAADPEGPYYAVYPKTASLNEQFDVNLASHVTEDRAASIINAISVAYSETNTLKFKNVCSIMKFQVPEFAEDITEITVSSDDALSGTAKVSYNAGEPTWGESGVGDLKYSITLTLPDNAKFEKDTEYYVPIYPGTKKNLVFRINGYLAATVSSVDFERSEIRGIGTIPAPVESPYKLMGINGDWSTGISFYNDKDYDVLKNVSLSENQEFKFKNGGSWLAVNGTATTDSWAIIYENIVGNMKLEAGTYDLYISKSAHTAYIAKSSSLAPKVVIPEEKHVYLQPSLNWLEANAKFVAWVWKDTGAGKAYNFKESEVKGIYEVDITGCNKIIIIRMDPSTSVTDSSTSWPGDGWAKTGNLDITGNLYTVVNWLEESSKFSEVTTLL